MGIILILIAGAIGASVAGLAGAFIGIAILIGLLMVIEWLRSI